MSLNATTTRNALPQIHEEWAARRYSDSARHHFDQWTAQYPALRGYELAEIPFRVSTLPRGEADAVLHSLIALSQDGFSLAGLCILEAFSPRIVRLVEHTSVQGQFADLNDRYAHVVVAAWEAISTYNLALTQKVVANFAMNMLKYAAPYSDRKIARHETCASGDDLQQHIYTAIDTKSDTHTASAQVDVILSWAQDKQVLNSEGIHLIRSYYLTHTTHVERLDLAARLGISRDALYQRVHRLLSRLQTAVSSHIKRDNSQPF